MLQEWGCGVRQTILIFQWVRPWSCGCPGSFSRTMTLHAKFLDLRYSFQTSLYCDGVLPHSSTNDWQPFLCLICQPSTQGLFCLFKKSCHNNLQNKFSHSEKHWYCLQFSWWNEEYGALLEWKSNMVLTITYVIQYFWNYPFLKQK